MKKADRKHDEFTGRAGWNLLTRTPTPPVLTVLDKKAFQSKIRTMSDADVDRLLK